MATTVKQLKICSKGHKYYKSSDCPTCPICENEKKPQTGFLSLVSAPARRALATLSISSLTELAKFTKKDIAKLHGMGPSGIKILETALNKEGLGFKK
jgi:hypothetical protein